MAVATTVRDFESLHDILLYYFKTMSGVSKICSLGRPPSLLARLGWGRCGLRGLGSSGVGVGEESGVLGRGSVPVLVLLMGVRLPGLGDGLLFLLARLALRSPWCALSFGRSLAWSALLRGVVSFLVL